MGGQCSHCQSAQPAGPLAVEKWSYVLALTRFLLEFAILVHVQANREECWLLFTRPELMR